MNNYRLYFTTEEFNNVINEPYEGENAFYLTLLYILILSKEFFELEVFHKTNDQKVPLSIENAIEMKDKIQKKLHKIEESEIIAQVKAIKEKLYFSDENEVILFDKVYPLMYQNLDIEPLITSKEVIIIIDKVKFQYKVCEKFLQADICKESKRELLQSYILNCFIENCPQLVAKSKEMIHPSLKHIKEYTPEIKIYLKNKVSEDELLYQIDMLKPQISYLKNAESFIFNKISADLNCLPSEIRQYNECILMHNDDASLAEVAFDEHICQKLLDKKIDENSLRELTQTYFYYQYNKALGKIIKDVNGKILEIDNSIEKIENYIDKIHKKLEGKIDDKIFDESVRIVTDWLSDEEIKTITRKVIYPIKKALNLTTPSVFGHIL